ACVYFANLRQVRGLTAAAEQLEEELAANELDASHSPPHPPPLPPPPPPPPDRGPRRIRPRHSDLFARKSVDTLLREMDGGERLHRVLGPLALTALGVGATVGTGIYVLTGEVARNYAGPSMMLSFLLA